MATIRLDAFLFRAVAATLEATSNPLTGSAIAAFMPSSCSTTSAKPLMEAIEPEIDAVVLAAPDRAAALGPRLGTVRGYGCTSNAWRITASPPDGRGAAEAMRLPATAAHPQALTHHMGLYFMASRGAVIASTLTWTD